jgi:hypothetical protein
MSDICSLAMPSIFLLYLLIRVMIFLANFLIEF